MKLALQIILTGILAYVLSLMLPFWSVAIAGFMVAIIFNEHAFLSFLGGFLGIALLWGLSTWFLSEANNHILLPKVSAIFSLSSFLMIVVISVIGGLLGGLAAATGTQLRRLIFIRTTRKRYLFSVGFF